MALQFVEKQWSDVSRITFGMYVASITMNIPRYILYITFAGEYRSGSAGASDATFMHAMARVSVEVWDPDAIILDYSKLSYTWGDEMEWMLPDDNGESEDIPAVVIVGEQSREGIRTLQFGIHSPKTLDNTTGIFEDRDAALKQIEQRVAHV